jgi:nucleotide-binding universal stress UspA family protein
MMVSWARLYGAEVEVFHAIRETAVLFAPYAVVGSSDFEGEMYDAAKQRMRRVLERLTAQGIFPKSKIVYGRPEEEILRRAETTNADLIAIGTRGYSGLNRFLLGSVAQRVLRHAPCSVLVVNGSEDVRHKSLP